MGLKKIRHRQFFGRVKCLEGQIEVPDCVPYSLYPLGSKFGIVISLNQLKFGRIENSNILSGN